MEQQKLQYREIGAHIRQMIGIAEHDFCRLTLVEQQSLRDYYLEVRQAMKISTRAESWQNEVYNQDFEAQFLGDIQPETYRKLQKVAMENRGFELDDAESMEIVRDQVLERMATSNLKAIEGYIAYHPTDEDARVIRSNSMLILSKIKAGRKMIFPRAAAPIGDIGLQVPNTNDEVPFEPPSIRMQSEIRTIQHICAMDRYRGILPEELRLSEYQLRQGVPICADECLHHICATDRYRGYSPEELRLNDYQQGQKLPSSSVTRATGDALTEVPAPGHLENTAQTSGPTDSSAPAYVSLFNPPIIIID